uniref:Uncharacterized protein n=1 Tax=Timema bartmani TaxID=61472 RepID=A0A7R9FDN5_9NEOP|nr:unnamed protein product [Timema bartmani]
MTSVVGQYLKNEVPQPERKFWIRAEEPVSYSDLVRLKCGALINTERHLPRPECNIAYETEPVHAGLDIKCLHQQKAINNIAMFAEEGVAFLNNRQEFWRQQRPSTASTKKIIKKAPHATTNNTRLAC